LHDCNRFYVKSFTWITKEKTLITKFVIKLGTFLTLSHILLLNGWAGEIEWRPTLQKAFEEGVKNKKPLFVVMDSKTCRYCVKYKREVLSQDAVSEYVNQNFIPIILDTQNDTYPEFLEVRGTPTTFILYTDGSKRYKKMPGYQHMMSLMATLQKLPK